MASAHAAALNCNDLLTLKPGYEQRVADFDRITPAMAYEAFQTELQKARQAVARITNSLQEPTFKNTIHALETVDEKMERAYSMISYIDDLKYDDSTSELLSKMESQLTDYSMEFTQNKKLHQRIKSVYDPLIVSKDLKLADKRLLENAYKGLEASGAYLSQAKQKTLQKIKMRLGKLSQEFSKNIQKSSEKLSFSVVNPSELAGLEPGFISLALAAAEKKGLSNQYLIEARSNILNDIIENAANEELRKRAWQAKAQIGMLPELNNERVVLEIVKSRKELAQLFGYDSYAQLSLKERMAQTPEIAKEYLLKLKRNLQPAVEAEKTQLENFAKTMAQPVSLEPWNRAYIARLYKEKTLSFKESEAKEYFEFEQSMNGVFEVYNELYGIRFEKIAMPHIHSDMVSYKVIDQSGGTLGLVTFDYFSREGKSGGAYHGTLLSQGEFAGKKSYPQLLLKLNFSPAKTDGKILLKPSDVVTALHETGHAMHSLFSNVRYSSLSGTKVYRDFVEVPSTFMEHWFFEPRFLNIAAKHYQTGAPIPHEIIQKLKESESFMMASSLNRQIEIGLFDLAWHDANVLQWKRISDLETSVLGKAPVTLMSPVFSHIFSGGYAAGYYSYLWSDVISADAFAYFKENGTFNTTLAEAFRKEVLSRGSLLPPSELYRNFRGQDPDPDALLKSKGF